MRTIRRNLLRLAIGFFLASGSVLAAGPAPGGTCSYLQVVDACQNDVLIFNVGSPYIEHNVSLNLPYEAFTPGGASYATVPGYAEHFSFVTQGPYLRVIDQRKALPYRTVDVEFDLGISGIRLNKVEAAQPVTVATGTRYALYVSGLRYYQGVYQPYFVVLDQQRLLQMSLNPSELVLGHGALCADGACSGTALDIAVSGPLSGGIVQEAYASVLNTEPVGGRQQRFYRISQLSSGAFDVTLDPWNEEGVAFGGLAHRSIGLDYDAQGLRPFGLFQTSAVSQDLLSGEVSCNLPGDPTDIEVWGPGTGFEHATYQFVTTRQNGNDLLLGFPEGECPTSWEGALTLPVGDYPRALGIASDSEDTFWIYTANKDHGVSAVRVQIVNEGQRDRIEVLEELDIPFAGCPIDIAFREASYTSCAGFEVQPNPAQPQPPEPECLDPWDPACIDPEEQCNPATGTCTLHFRPR